MSKKTVIRVSLLVIGAVMIAAGLAQGDTHSVMQKAIHICYECIGIG